MTQDGYIPVDSATLRTSFPGVYAVGDVATVGVPKAGVFAEGAARIVAQSLISELRGEEPCGRLRRQGLVLHRVRPGPRRPRRRRLPLRSLADRRLQRAVRRARRTEGALRLQPPRPLVRHLTLPKGLSHGRLHDQEPDGHRGRDRRHRAGARGAVRARPHRVRAHRPHAHELRPRHAHAVRPQPPRAGGGLRRRLGLRPGQARRRDPRHRGVGRRAGRARRRCAHSTAARTGSSC